jgi:anti-sigma regulatory factor (Ser/Thr protein kinase)
MLKLKANLGYLKEFVDCARKKAASAGFAEDQVKQVELVTEEAVVNIINYAYPDQDGMIQFSCIIERGTLTIEIIDSGRPFNPLEYVSQDVGIDINSRQVGGLGIILIKQYMDEVQYRYKNKQNILILKKHQ